MALSHITPTPFTVDAQDMGLKPGIDPAELSKQADLYEIEAFQSTTRRLMVAEDADDDSA